MQYISVSFPGSENSTELTKASILGLTPYLTIFQSYDDDEGDDNGIFFLCLFHKVGL